MKKRPLGNPPTLRPRHRLGDLSGDLLGAFFGIGTDGRLTKLPQKDVDVSFVLRSGLPQLCQIADGEDQGGFRNGDLDDLLG